MSVFKRGKVFYCDFVNDGVRVCKSTGKTTKKEAKHFEIIERQKLLSGSTTKEHKAAKLTLQDAIDQIYSSKWSTNKDGMGTYRRALLLLGHMGNVPIYTLDIDSVNVLVKKLEATGIESSTVNRYLATLKTILKHFRLQADYIRLRKESNGRIRVLTRDEESCIVSLLRSAEGKKPYYIEAADMVEVLTDSGLRLSELLNLKYEDINYTSNLISIWINKGDRPRSIPMTRRVRVILEERQHINSIKPFTITRDEAERAWQWVRAVSGLKNDSEFVIHALRHTTASRLVNAGVDLYVVCNWLGHSSIKITERYAHLDPNKLVHAAEVLEQ